jgi:hypothetical protein
VILEDQYLNANELRRFWQNRSLDTEQVLGQALGCQRFQRLASGGRWPNSWKWESETEVTQ